MSDLSEKKCVPCEGGIPSFNLSEISFMLPFFNKTDDLMLGHTGPTITTSSPSLIIKSQTNLSPIIPPVTTL